jgi:clan AA aspartic protease
MDSLVTYITVKVANLTIPKKHLTIKFLIDSGAVYSLVPSDILKSLGIKPHSERRLVLANGDEVVRKSGTAVFEYRGHRGDSLVIFGESGDKALLGATTLESFGFILDPFRRELKPLPMMLA